MSKSRTTTLKTELLAFILILAKSVTARKMASAGLKHTFDEPDFSGIPKKATEDVGQYIVKFTDGSLEYLDRLKAAEANEEDGGDRIIRHLSAKSNKSSKSKIKKHYKADKKNFLVKSSAEVILADTDEEAAEWGTHEEVEYVEPGEIFEIMTAL